ncbi:hypothetical protein BDZ89DRAFT_1095444 [Hymenopellis radicata]|nr:hypothetical protein BDZ89DRAFT_1095444 [Hymenopellis radicata]
MPSPVVLHELSSPAVPRVSSFTSTTATGEVLSLKLDSNSVTEKLPWGGYLEVETFGISFSPYHRLFGIVFISNMAVLIVLFIYGADSQRLGLITVTNIFIAILMRQDYVVNALFAIFTSVPPSWPLWFRLLMARVYHLGGVHSGAAVSGTIWLAALAAQVMKEYVHGDGISVATVAVTWVILVFLAGIVTFAYPSFRSKSHNTFERIHRFLGWTVTALVWVQLVLLTKDWTAGGFLGYALLHSTAFWLMIVSTVSLALPWTRLRKIPVRSVVLSDHAVRLFVDYKVFGFKPAPQPGSFSRISLDPFNEWHAFANFPAGDWTTKVISDPPKEVWIRGTPVFGVLRVNIMFRRVVFVATGSGIGPIAPCLLEQRQPCRLLWTGSNIRKTFGNELVNTVLEAEPGAVLYDTRIHGRPDMVKLTYKIVQDFEAEAVVVISNEPLTKKLVYDLMSRGIPAFGAIWDS